MRAGGGGSVKEMVRLEQGRKDYPVKEREWAGVDEGEKGAGPWREDERERERERLVWKRTRQKPAWFVELERQRWLRDRSRCTD